MKKALKIAIPAAILVLAGIGLYFTFPLLAMKPAETGIIDANNLTTYALRSGRGNLYLVDTGEGYLMIDAGASVKSVEAGLGELRIHSSEIKWVLLTHTHGDHVAALPLFPHAEVYMGSSETPPAAPQNIKLLSGDESLIFGNVEIECIAAPGHTPGSMTYCVRTAGWERSHLFTGDALRWSSTGANRGMGVHPFTMDKALAEETIANLPTDAWMILTSHYGWFYPPILP